MYVFYATPNGTPEEAVDLDPALLAFVKCHVTSPAKWAVLRLLAERDGQWLSVDDVVGAVHRSRQEVGTALDELAREEVAQREDGRAAAPPRYRVSRDEPSGLVLHRLMEATMSSQEMRGIIAAHLLRSQNGRTRAA